MLLTRLKTVVSVLLAVVILGAGLATAGQLFRTPPAERTPERAEEQDAKKAGEAATADDKRGDRPVLLGTLGKKDGELKIEFADKDVMKIAPHGDSAVLGNRSRAEGDKSIATSVCGRAAHLL